MPLVQPDYGRFVSEVQPILASRCANPSCHGRLDRPLAVYAIGMWRADPAQLFENTPLTADELRANYTRACSFIVAGAAPADCLLVRKPLAPDAGGATHLGGVVFTDTAEADYRGLLDWIASAKGSP